MLRGNASEILAVAGAAGRHQGCGTPHKAGVPRKTGSSESEHRQASGCRSEGCQELGGQVQLCRLDASAPCRLPLASSRMHEVVCISGAVDFVAAQTARSDPQPASFP